MTKMSRLFGAFAEDGGEDEVEFFGFLPDEFGFLAQLWNSTNDHAAPVFGFAGLFLAGSDLVSEILVRDCIISLDIIGSNTGP
jgi:hypothetical protein